MSEFFHMNGYGEYVLPAYIITIVVFIGLGVLIRNRRARLQYKLDLLDHEQGKMDTIGEDINPSL